NTDGTDKVFLVAIVLIHLFYICVRVCVCVCVCVCVSVHHAPCLVNGIALFEGAAWSPDPCSVCRCRNGAVHCHAIACPGTGVTHIHTHIRRFDTDDHDDDDYMDDNSDIDDDEDDDRTILNSPSRQWGALSANRPPAYAASRPALPPPKRPVTPPTRQYVAPPAGQPAASQRGSGQRVIHPYPHMASLPTGCLMSQSLIACGSTGLSHLPLLKDPGIRALYLAGDSLTVRLFMFFSVIDNKISKIPTWALAGLPNLEWLDLSKNQLNDASLGVDVFRNLTKLRRLNLDGNNLTKIPPLPLSLLELKINDNKLMAYEKLCLFAGLFQLLTLELEDNHFHDGNVSPLAFRTLGKLIYLRLDDNDFRAIPSGLPASLQELHLSDNRIEVVHAGLLNKTVNLRVLNLSHNKIREDRIAPRAWIHLRKLESLDLSHNKLVHVPSFLPAGLRQLTLHHNQIERIPAYVFGHLRPGLDSLHLSYNRLREDGISEMSFLGLYHSLTELLLDHNRLQAIPRGILQLQTLQVLHLNHNYINSVSMNALCDTTAREDSPLLSVHLENNLIDRRLVPPTALSCIRNYHSVLLRPQRHEQIY
uniref:Si:dkey-6n6.1 n=1 Tax=Electrophorus electricus TaxID=8005 RepID=A0A4W4ESL4_ELEEL